MKQNQKSYSGGKKLLVAGLFLLALAAVSLLIKGTMKKDDFTQADFQADSWQLRTDLESVISETSQLEGVNVEESTAQCALGVIQDINNQPGGQTPVVKVVNEIFSLDESKEAATTIRFKLDSLGYNITDSGMTPTNAGVTNQQFIAHKGRVTFTVQVYSRSESSAKILIDGSTETCI